MANLRNKVVLLYHWFVVLFFSYFLRISMTYDPSRKLEDDLCQMSYFNMFIMLGCFFTKVVYDMKILLASYGNQETPSHHHHHRYPEYIYIWSQITFALSGFISLSYWAIRLYDYNMLLAPESIPSPAFLSFIIHGANWIALFIEWLLFPQINIRGALWKLALFATVILIYLNIQVLFWLTTGKHAYPFLSNYSWMFTVVFYTGLFILTYIMDRYGYWVTTMRWGDPKIIKELIKMDQMISFNVISHYTSY